MFKFTIRELLLLTVIVAMGTGGVVDRFRLCRERDRAVERLEFALAGKELWKERATSLADHFQSRGWTIEVDQSHVKIEPP
jgi:hypothetical protein